MLGRQAEASAGLAGDGGAIGRVLCVDDDPGVLDALKRALRRQGLEVLTADGGAAALRIMRERAADVVVSDMQMPHMDGAELLEEVRRRWPDVARVVLTGCGRADTAVAAINRAQVHSYLAKPWSETALREAVDCGLVAARGRRLERETQVQSQQVHRQLREHIAELDGYLHELKSDQRQRFLGHVNALTNLQQLRSPVLADHAQRVAAAAGSIARALGLPSADVLALQIAGLLHDIGLIGLRTSTLQRGGVVLTEHEQALYEAHPRVAALVLPPMVEMREIAAIIAAHHEHVDGTGLPGHLTAAGLTISARILAVAEAADECEHGWMGTEPQGERELQRRLRQGCGTLFDERVVDVYLRKVRRRDWH